jgi:hypothetical protein
MENLHPQKGEEGCARSFERLLTPDEALFFGLIKKGQSLSSAPSAARASRHSGRWFQERWSGSPTSRAPAKARGKRKGTRARLVLRKKTASEKSACQGSASRDSIKALCLLMRPAKPMPAALAVTCIVFSDTGSRDFESEIQ